MASGKPRDGKDDLEAVRSVAETLEGFAADERERIIRWVRERLGMQAPAPTAAPAPANPPGGPAPAPAAPGTAAGAQDIKSFSDQKRPRTDSQFAAIVAYFHRFIAKGDDKKDVITSNDYLDACRKADWNRPARPAQVLVDAFHEGVLDRAERGSYKISSVGENLVAMVLPDSGGDAPAGRTSKKAATKKARGKK